LGITTEATEITEITEITETNSLSGSVYSVVDFKLTHYLFRRALFALVVKSVRL